MKKKLFSIAKNSLGSLIVGLAFEKASKLLPIERIYENSKIIVFWHPKPSYEKHILIVPKKSIKDISVINKENKIYLYEVFKAVTKVVSYLNLKDYSVITNGGLRQEIKQLHFHLISGKKLSEN